MYQALTSFIFTLVWVTQALLLPAQPIVPMNQDLEYRNNLCLFIFSMLGDPVSGRLSTYFMFAILLYGNDSDEGDY